MPPKPYRLINYEKEYARTDSAPEESSYRDHKLRDRVQAKADKIDVRIDSLNDDVTWLGLCSEVTIQTHQRPYELGRKFGKIAAVLFADEDTNKIEFHSGFLAGAIDGLDRRAPHDHMTAPTAREYRSNLLADVRELSAERLKKEKEVAEGQFEYTELRDDKIRQAEEYIKKILKDNNIQQTSWIAQQVRYELVDVPSGFPNENQEWDPTDPLSAASILSVVEDKSLKERQSLRDQISKDMERLQIARRGQEPAEIFEYIASQTNHPVHTDDIVRELGKKDVTVTILNDLAGIEGRRESGREQVLSDSPLLQKEGDNLWTMTAYGNVMADWLYSDDFLPHVEVEKELKAISELDIE